MNSSISQPRQIQSSLSKISGELSVYPRGKLIGGKLYKPRKHEDSPTVVWDVETNSRESHGSSASSLASKDLNDILDGESTHLPVVRIENSEPGHESIEYDEDSYFSKEYYCKWKPLKGLRDDSVLSMSKAYSDYTHISWKSHGTGSYKLTDINQFQDLSWESCPLPLLPSSSIPNQDTYFNMLSTHLEDSKYGPPKKDFNKPTFTCPSCQMLHWRPGKCPCCTIRPKKPVLLCLPWRSPKVATGLNPRSSLKGKRCIFHQKIENENLEIKCSASALREVLSARKELYSNFPGLHLSVSPDEMSPHRATNEIKLPNINTREHFMSPWLQNISKLLNYTIPDSPKLPSLSEDPPILSAARYREGSRRYSRSGLKVSTYLDARSTCLLRQKKVQTNKLPCLFLKH